MAAIANSLLAALPRTSYLRLLPSLVPVELAFGEVLYEPGMPIRDVYFPGRSLVSLLTLVEGHLALEVGLVGRDGMVGVPLALGIDASPVRALVQGAGPAFRMNAARFRRELSRSLPLQGELYRYVHTLMAQISQTAGCNRFHVVQARLARWLLMTRDRVRSGGIPHDARVPLAYAGRAQGRRDRGRQCPAAAQADRVQPRQHHHP
jgi:CRP-like cAMP-binding protein